MLISKNFLKFKEKNEDNLLGITAKFYFQYQANLRELINLCSTRNLQETIRFMMISGGIENNSFG